MSRLFLGLDLSTQSMSAVVTDLDEKLIIYEKSLNFDTDIPGYDTQAGTLRFADDPKAVHGSPLQWAEALDKIFAEMKADGVALSEILAVSGSGQQHGSVYFDSSIEGKLENLASAENLKSVVESALSRKTAPIWMDSSTTAECREITDAMGGANEVLEATGSVAFERFTGPQIRKFSKTDADGYAATSSIMLVSSYLASLVSGKIAAIDHGDAAGMNLLDIREKLWNADALEATSENIAEKLGSTAPSCTVVGKVSEYFTKNYGLNPDALSLVWSGDNPNSLVGLGLIEGGMTAISLGTSDTCFACLSECPQEMSDEAHIFVSPTGDYMSLLCFKNGSLAREAIKDKYNLDWDEFSSAIESTPVGNDGAILLPYFEPEIVPKVLEAGVKRFDLDENDAAKNCRAVVETQMLSMRLHAEKAGVKFSSIRATGGASKNKVILQIMANVFGCRVDILEATNSAGLGSALRATHGYLCANNEKADWKEIVGAFDGEHFDPDAEAGKVYDEMLKKLAEFEAASRG